MADGALLGYGFILRYPNEKSEITGIIYEPWHYRYVGGEDAEQMHSLGVLMEFHANEGKDVLIQANGKVYARHAITAHFVQVGESYGNSDKIPLPCKQEKW